MWISRVAVGFVQSLELKGKPMNWVEQRTHEDAPRFSLRVSSFTFKNARLHWQFAGLLDNSGFSYLYTIFTSPFLVNYINFPLNWENKNSLLCKLCFVTGNQTVRVFTTSKQKVNWVFCCLIKIYQQTIELCKYVTPRLILSFRVARAIDSCSLNSPNA